MATVITISQKPRAIKGNWFGPDRELFRSIARQSPEKLGAVIGFPGSSGNSFTHTQNSAAATWNIPHSLGKIPIVAVYLLSGEKVETDVEANETNVTVTFANATAGRAILV